MRVRAPAAFALMYLLAGSAVSAEDGSGKTAAPDDSAAVAGQSTPKKLLTQRFVDWSYRCVRSQTSSEAVKCEISQTVEVEQDEKRTEVLNLALSRASDKGGKVKWALVVLVPLDIHLPSRFGLQVAKRKPIQIRYRNCNHLGCWAVYPATRPMIEGLKKSKSGAGLFRLLNGKVIKVLFSLKGFTKAFNAMSSGGLPVSPSVEQSRLKR